MGYRLGVLSIFPSFPLIFSGPFPPSAFSSVIARRAARPLVNPRSLSLTRRERRWHVPYSMENTTLREEGCGNWPPRCPAFVRGAMLRPGLGHAMGTITDNNAGFPWLSPTRVWPAANMISSCYPLCAVSTRQRNELLTGVLVAT